MQLFLFSCFFANLQRWSEPRNERFDYIRHTEQVRRLFGSFPSHLWHLVWMGITVHFNKGQKSRSMLSALFHLVISLLKIFSFLLLKVFLLCTQVLIGFTDGHLCSDCSFVWLAALIWFVFSVWYSLSFDYVRMSV